MKTKEISRLTLDIRGVGKLAFLQLLLFRNKPVRLMEDWRNLTQLSTSNNSAWIMRINLNSNYTISTERNDERSTVYDDM